MGVDWFSCGFSFYLRLHVPQAALDLVEKEGHIWSRRCEKVSDSNDAGQLKLASTPAKAHPSERVGQSVFHSARFSKD